MDIKDIKKIFDLRKKINSVIVVDISSKLKLLGVELSPNIVVSASKIIDLPKEATEEIIVTTLRNFIKENNIKHKNVILGLALDAFQIKRLNLPVMPERELPEAIKWQIKDDLNFDVNQAVIDFKIISKIAKEDGSNVFDIICVIANNNILKKFISLLRPLGLNLLSINVLPFAYAYVVERYLYIKKNEPVACLYIDVDSCFLSIYRDTNLYFFRELPMLSISNMKTTLKANLTSDKERIELTAQEIDDILFRVGVSSPAVDYYKDKISYLHILSAIRPYLEKMINEIKRSFDYYDSQYGEGSLEHLFICGPGAQIVGLDTFLSKEIKLRILRFDFLDKVSILDSLDRIELREAIYDLALAFDFQRSVNLLPFEYRHQEYEEAEKVSLRMVALIAFLLLFVFYMFAKVKIDGYNRRLESASIHLGVLSELKQLNDKVLALENLVATIQGKQPCVATILKLLSNIAPKELFIKDFVLDKANKNGLIKGFVISELKNPDAILTEFMKKIEDTKIITDLGLSSVEKSEEGSVGISKFEMNYRLK